MAVKSRGVARKPAKEPVERVLKHADAVGRGMFKVTATRMGYYDHARQKPGTEFMMELEIDKNNEPVPLGRDDSGEVFCLPTWVVLSKDYVPEEDESALPRDTPDFIKL